MSEQQVAQGQGQGQGQGRATRAPITRRVVFQAPHAFGGVPKDYRGWLVQITKSDQFIPRYSLSLSNVREDGTLAPYVPITIGNLKLGKPDIGKEIQEVSAALAAAQTFLEEEAAFQAMRVTEDAQLRDEKKANYGKPVTRVTGKTAKRKARLAARASG